MKRSAQFFRGGLALRPTSIAAAATATGPVIERPSDYGKSLAIRIVVSDHSGVTALVIGVDGRDKEGNWVAVKGLDGNNLAFDDTLSGGSLDVNGTAKGTLAVDRLPYTAYRLAVRTVTGATVLLAATYEILDIFDSGDNVPVQKDHFLFKGPGLQGYNGLNGTSDV
jgi:hypothetical protein